MEVSKSLCQLEDNFTLTSSHCIRGSHFKKSKFISETDNKLEILKCSYVCKCTKLSLVFWTGASTSLHYTSLTWTFVLLYIFIWKWNTNKQQTFEARFYQILLEGFLVGVGRGHCCSLSYLHHFLCWPAEWDCTRMIWWQGHILLLLLCVNKSISRH